MFEPINSFISYPRSGWHWFLIRAAAFLRHCLEINFHEGAMENVIKRDMPTHPPYPGHKIFMGCAGYDFSEGGVFNLKGTLKDISTVPSSAVFLNFRDARAILPSYYNFLQYYLGNPRLPEKVKDITIDEFIMSSEGISRVCDFVNNMEILIESCPVPLHCLYYEDNFSIESVHMVPKILGIDYNMSEEEVKRVFEMSSMSTIQKGNNRDIAKTDISVDGKHGMYRIGDTKSYKQEMSEESLKYINDYLDKYCTLESYRKRYING